MSATLATSEPEVLSEVPDTLKRLVKFIVRGFYETEHCLIIDLLVHHPCIKEDDLLELLKFDRKQLRQMITNLKNDKFLKSRMRVETDSEGKATRHNYYFINYGVFVNVVKYKLDHMRRKIETEERDSTNRSSFICPQCAKQFTDLEVGQLLDPMTGELHCTFCHAEVSEEHSEEPKMDARSLMVKFNEQIEPIYNLLREVEDIRLAQHILEPEPTDLSSITNPKEKKSQARSGEKEWSTTKTGMGIDYAMSNTVTINLDAEAEAKAASNIPKKEKPIWMTTSTIEGASADYNEPPLQKEPSSKVSAAGSGEPTKAPNNDDIMKMLFAHEKKSSSTSTIPGVPSVSGGSGMQGSDNDSSTSESEDEAPKTSAEAMFGLDMNMISSAPSTSTMVEEMESDEEEIVMVSIGSQQVQLHEVTPQMVEQMTAHEKEVYIRLSQEAYQDMY